MTEPLRYKHTRAGKAYADDAMAAPLRDRATYA
jgi:hypothetical protein